MPLSFYRRNTRVVARELLGKILCRRLPDGLVLRGRIVEVEAYLGARDAAAHTFGGRRTTRNASMWKSGGNVYVYLIYGMHECMNIVTREEGDPEAVLIRALEPVEGHDFLRATLPHLPEKNWLKGPGRLCRAFRITRALDGATLTGPELWLEDGPKPSRGRIAASGRIGVDYAGEAAEWPLRFFEAGSVYVSGPARMNKRK